MSKTAVVLFNLGGPDRMQAVRPFLFNLFFDAAIIGLPAILRWPLAAAMAARRAPVAREIFSHLGGGSPLLANTEAQAEKLAEKLTEDSIKTTAGADPDVRVFIAMRYWHPMSLETATAVRDFGPKKVILLPLYPQFSTTTTGSSLTAWNRAARRIGLNVPTTMVCCYPTDSGFVAALAAAVRGGLAEAAKAGYARPRVLFSAHGLPRRVVARGDPYQWQVARTAAAVAARVVAEGPRGKRPGGEDLDWITCYQSRVGPLEWIGPATKDEIRRAGAEGRALVVVPIVFVSEHSETLVELDIQYRELAAEVGVPAYIRVPTVATADDFIAALAALVRKASTGAPGMCRGVDAAPCPDHFTACPCRAPAP